MNEANRIVNTDEDQLQGQKEGARLERYRSAMPKLLIDNTKKEPNLPVEESFVTPGRKLAGFNWFRTDRDYCQKMLQIDLNRTEQRVMHALMFKMSVGNMVHQVKHRTLSELTGIAESHISVAIGKLVEHDMIIKIERSEYMINPFYVYMGDGESRSNSISKYRRLKQDQINKAAPSRP